MSLKTKKTIFEWVFLIGCILAICAFNGINKGINTTSEILMNIGVSIFTMLVGIVGMRCTDPDDDDDWD